MFIHNKKPFEFASLPFSLIQAIIWNYQNRVPKCNLFLESNHKIFQPSKYVLKLFKFLEEAWKLPVHCWLWHLQQCGWIGPLGETQPWEKQHVRDLSAAPALSDCSWIVEQRCPSTCSSILSPLRVTGIQWSGWNMSIFSCVNCPTLRRISTSRI